MYHQTAPRQRQRSARPPLAQPRLSGVIREMLVWRGPFDASRIGIEICSGVVTLHGELDSPEQIREACRLARSVVGVHEVRSRIELAGAPLSFTLAA
jgi:hypothetical protein